MKKSFSIPNFENDAKAADFFDTHDTTELLSQTIAAKLSFPKPTHKVVVELQENQWQKLLKIANSRRLSYTKILRAVHCKRITAVNSQSLIKLIITYWYIYRYGEST